MGPLLFLIYINDISNTSNEGEFILFADDTNIFVRGQTALLAFKTANEILRKVNDYMYVNKLHINMEKCCFIHFKPGNTNKENTVTAEFDVKIGGTPPEAPSVSQICTGLPPAVPDLGWLSLVHPDILHQVKVTCLASVSKFRLVCHQPCQI